MKRDFLNPLHAAFEPAKLQAQLHNAGLDDRLGVNLVSDRHVAVRGGLH
ncbi:hypothetical protein [Thiohalocapsa marina]|nr:hypothetical protein [Thiohalocapsa marina]